uniref:Uncharacterized protein n=1 Tax=Anguilla anguilla TaxID=7936 RepID=A0A0E9PJP0_ANGAN
MICSCKLMNRFLNDTFSLKRYRGVTRGLFSFLTRNMGTVKQAFL